MQEQVLVQILAYLILEVKKASGENTLISDKPTWILKMLPVQLSLRKILINIGFSMAIAIKNMLKQFLMKASISYLNLQISISMETTLYSQVMLTINLLKLVMTKTKLLNVMEVYFIFNVMLAILLRSEEMKYLNLILKILKVNIYQNAKNANCQLDLT